MFIGDDRDYKKIQQIKRDGDYVFATCYPIEWGFLLPCESGVVFEQQTDGVCCHHVYMEGVLIPLSRPRKFTHCPPGYVDLLDELKHANYMDQQTDEIWDDIKRTSHIQFEFIDSPDGMPYNQEGFQWIEYRGHEDGWGNTFSLEAVKGRPIVLIYPNSD